MNHSPSDFEQIVASIEQNPALVAAKEAISSIESLLNAPDASLETLNAIKDGELKALNEQWPYRGKLVKVSGNVFLMNKERQVTDIAPLMNETVLSDGFELAYLQPTADNPMPTWSVVSQLRLPLEDEIIDAIAITKDTLFSYDDPELTSQHL